VSQDFLQFCWEWPELFIGFFRHQKLSVRFDRWRTKLPLPNLYRLEDCGALRANCGMASRRLIELCGISAFGISALILPSTYLFWKSPFKIGTKSHQRLLSVFYPLRDYNDSLMPLRAELGTGILELTDPLGQKVKVLQWLMQRIHR